MIDFNLIVFFFCRVLFRKHVGKIYCVLPSSKLRITIVLIFDIVISLKKTNTTQVSRLLFANNHVFVFTLEPPQFISELPNEKVVKEGESFELVCEAEGEPTPSVEWIRNGVREVSGSVLSIQRAEKSHNGEYTCRVYSEGFEPITGTTRVQIYGEKTGISMECFDRIDSNKEIEKSGIFFEIEIFFYIFCIIRQLRWVKKLGKSK